MKEKVALEIFKTLYFLQVSTNGLVSFGRPYLSWWPIPFPFGYSKVPIIAPCWVDFDFRNNLPDSRVYYKSYDRSNNSLLQQAVFQEFDRRLQEFDRRIQFRAEWMIVITWKLAVPYFTFSGVRKQFSTYVAILPTGPYHWAIKKGATTRSIRPHQTNH